MDGTLNKILLLLIDNNAGLGGVVLAYVILVQGVQQDNKLVMLTTASRAPKQKQNLFNNL